MNLRGLEGNEMGYKGMGALHLQTWMGVIRNLYGSEPQHFKAGWRGRDLDGGELQI